MSRIAITGASGFLGSATVRAALEAGHEVTALVRDPQRAPGGTRVAVLDLALATEADLREALADADAVIHAAATMTGDDAAHEIHTIAPTQRLISAMTGQAARLVLVSSFSVYGFSAIPAGSVLTETSPTESRPQNRDAYARAKLKQEDLALAAARDGLAVRILRPGAIYGPGRLMSGQLGILRGDRVICIGGDAAVPAIHVDHCARALVAAATGPLGTPDLPDAGQVEIINLVDPDPPTQSEWLSAAGAKNVSRIPLGLMTGAARLLAPLGRKVPTGLRSETLAARYRPLRYDAGRARERLGFAPGRGFAEAMAASRENK